MATIYTREERARIAAALARHDAAVRRCIIRERVACLSAVVLIVAAVLALIYGASEPAPLPEDVTRADWSAHDLNGRTIARGLTLADCAARFFDCRLSGE